jgi:hypothetical protein
MTTYHITVTDPEHPARTLVGNLSREDAEQILEALENPAGLYEYNIVED